jgi:uncharacterized repeat protein (TIGR01451 family)
MTRNTVLSQGQNASYTINVTNNGPNNETGTVTVTDTLPNGLTYSSFSGSGWSCNSAGQTVTCTRTGLSNGASAPPLVLTVSVGGCSNGPKVNSVSVAGTNFDNVESNDTATDSYDMGVVPCAYYAMDESAWGAVTDSSGSGRHGTILGTPLPTGYPAASPPGAALTGNPGTCGAGQFPSNAGYGVNTGVDINTLGTAGTIAFWYSSNAAWNTSNNMLFDASQDIGNNSDDRVFYLFKDNNGALTFVVKRSGLNQNSRSVAKAPNTAFAANTWHHIAVTWDMGTDVLRIYRNGSLVATSNTTSAGAWGGTNSLYLGTQRTTDLSPGETYTANTANGNIDEVRLYSTALTPAQISQAMALTHTCPPPNHIRIEHDGAGLSCMPETVTVKACANAFAVRLDNQSHHIFGWEYNRRTISDAAARRYAWCVLDNADSGQRDAMLQRQQ